MAVNRGKQFEDVIKNAFLQVPNVSVVRLHDQTTGYMGSKNHCDFIVYKKPLEYHLECKSVHGNTLSIHSNDTSGKGEIYGNITKTQWQGLLEKSKIKGVIAGVICWWVNKDVTRFIPIQILEVLKTELGAKSIRFDFLNPDIIYIQGKKKRVFFEYDMEQFFKEVEDNG